MAPHVNLATKDRPGWALGFAGQPPGLATLFFTELWERFSFYGMRALLVLFMVTPVTDGGLGCSTVVAAAVYGNYTMAVYMLSLPGGYFADRYLGAHRAVLIGGAVIAAGHFTLALPFELSFYAGLVLVALGTGLFKPNISALVGGLYPAGDDRRDAGFSLFYMGINIGAFIAPLVTGYLAQSLGFKAWLTSHGFHATGSWHWGFAAAGFGMALGLAVFMSARARISMPHREAVSGNTPHSWEVRAVAGGTAVLMALALVSDTVGFQWLRYAFVVLPIAAVIYFARRGGEDASRIAAVFVLFIAAMIFWAIFEQAGLSIALFADRLTRTELLGVSFPSVWFQSLNALFVITLAPLFAIMWTRLGASQPSSPVKFALGLAFLSMSFLLMVPAAHLTANGKLSPWWLVGLFFLQTVGELLLSPVGLSTMTKLAPARFVGLVLGIWFLGAAFGNKLAGILGSGFSDADPQALAHFFLMQGLLVAAASATLFMLVPWVRKLMGGVR